MQTPTFVLAELMAGAIILAVGLFHLGLAWNGVRRRLNAIFFLMAVFTAGGALSSPERYLSAVVPDVVLGMKLAMGFVLAYAVALVWFAREYCGLQRRDVPILLSLFGFVVLALHVALPFSLFFESISGLRTISFPGGGTGYAVEGRPHPLILLGNAFGVAAMGYVVAGCVRLWKNRAARSQALTFTIGIGPLLLFAYPHGAIANRGLIDPPVYYTFGFLSLVGVMSYDILRDTVQSLSLTKESRSNERRWRTLLENVSLMVLVCDKEGRIEYANPFLLRTSGFEASELIGRPFDVLYPSAELPHIQNVFESAMQGSVLEQIQTGFLTRSKQERVIRWSNVLLYGSNDEVVGVLSLGDDLTHKVMAEKSRDEAMAQLAALKEQLEAENQYLRLEFEADIDSKDLIGRSDAVRYVLHKVNQVASTNATVLIEGETGVGKELVARAIHQASPRARMPFIRVNCAALPATLIETELFGHERGAFTSADRPRQGRFELAEGGTILLDEIGELGLDVQAKLLRVLQEGEFDKVGGTKTRKANVRVIASTNRNLQQDVAEGRFREDLYYRLQVFPISVPPLRERRDDIPLLVHHFVHRLAQKHGRPVSEVPMRVIRQLSERDWPGNVRELENVIERAVITSTGPVLALPSDIGAPSAGSGKGGRPDSLNLSDVERYHIEQVLKRTNGQIAGPGGAAELLGMHPNTLRGRMNKLGVQRPKGT